jgi:hypothetical protein
VTLAHSYVFWDEPEEGIGEPLGVANPSEAMKPGISWEVGPFGESPFPHVRQPSGGRSAFSVTLAHSYVFWDETRGGNW